MKENPDIKDLRSALTKAGAAHHNYETVHLRGVRDQQWAGWYAAHMHGQLGDFMNPSDLTRILEQTETDGDWIEAAAKDVLAAI